jgi:phenylacetate-coenzyme A ligase PaaK-like adenylate-forming protein
MAVYSRAPTWMQNLLISAYGVRLLRLRYGQVGRETLKRLTESQWQDRAVIRREQLATLSDVVARAASDVPFYRRRGLEGIDFDSQDQLRELPLLTKSEVQRAGREMISAQYAKRKLTEVHTGGTTGKPLAIHCDSATLQRNYAFFSRFKAWAGIGDGARVATFAGRTFVPARSGEPFWRHNRASNTLLFSSYHISRKSLPAYIDALKDFRPALIDSYPSSIEAVARYIVEHEISSIRPTAVITSSETLFPAVRDLVERAFKCRVFDYYGGAEMAAFIAQCEAGTYHIAPEFGVVEVLNDGQPVLPGERGEIVATGFINPAMPLIRYATGDYGVLGTGVCPCGRAGDTLEHIEGRMDDVIVTPEGNLVGRLDPIFKAVSSLYETRIVQDEIDHVRVEVVVIGEFSPASDRELRLQLRARLGPSMRIDIVRVASIERTGRGKLRTTVNLVYPRSLDRFAEAPT